MARVGTNCNRQHCSTQLSNWLRREDASRENLRSFQGGRISDKHQREQTPGSCMGARCMPNPEYRGLLSHSPNMHPECTVPTTSARRFANSAKCNGKQNRSSGKHEEVAGLFDEQEWRGILLYQRAHYQGALQLQRHEPRQRPFVWNQTSLSELPGLAAGGEACSRSALEF